LGPMNKKSELRTEIIGGEKIEKGVGGGVRAQQKKTGKAYEGRKGGHLKSVLR